MGTSPGRSLFILLAAALAALAVTEARGDDWVYYGASFQREGRGPELRDWYELNRLKPVDQAQATACHYYDRDSLGYSSPFPGGIVRVWEKAIFRRETKNFEDVKAEIEKEEERRLKRKISVVDYAWIFPAAVNRATKEITTLYEINCDSREFFILEANNYDKKGDRLTREANFDMSLWIPIQTGTVMEALCNSVCIQEKPADE